MDYLTPAQFAGWVSFAQIEPFGFDVDEARFSMLGSLISRLFGARGIPAAEFTIRPPQAPDPEAIDPKAGKDKKRDKLIAKLKKMLAPRGEPPSTPKLKI